MNCWFRNIDASLHSKIFAVQFFVLRIGQILRPLSGKGAKGEKTASAGMEGGDIMASPQTKVRYQFEAFCKKVINGERCDYLRELMRRSSWESSFSDLPPAILDRLYSENDDPAEYYIFRICGHVIPIRNDRLADALLTFGDEQYSILLLYYSLQLKDREIVPLLGISRSKVQRDRKTLFEELKSKMGE